MVKTSKTSLVVDVLLLDLTKRSDIAGIPKAQHSLVARTAKLFLSLCFMHV